MTQFPTLDRAELELVSRLQVAQQRTWQELPADGVEVECDGESFTVLPNVFPPRGDTRLLLDNLEIVPGSSVLDMGSGCGVLAILAVRRGARFAVAVDINPDAVRNTGLNVVRHAMEDRIEVRLLDGFSAIATTEKFDVILANLPGRNETAANLVEAAQWDSGFRTHKSFFAQVPHHLVPGGKIVMTKANYPELNTVVGLAERSGFETSILARKDPGQDDPRTYYALAFGR
jgi:release factor glutamine methyltransferase